MKKVEEVEKYLLHALIRLEVCSGAALAEELGYSRSGVWKNIRRLQKYGIEIDSIEGHGYRLKHPAYLYDVDKIRALLNPVVQQNCQISAHWVTTSTNTEAMNQLKANPNKTHIICTEYQSLGKGRNNKAWSAPLGSGLLMSAGMRLDVSPSTLGGLSLVIGLAVVRAIKSSFGVNVELKWPNDIYFDGKKLGGILIEVSGEHAGPCDVVIGLGLNGDLSQRWPTNIGQPFTDIASITTEPFEKNLLTAQIVCETLDMTAKFCRDGFSSFLQEWQQADMLNDKVINVSHHGQVREGHYCGVNTSGALMVNFDGEVTTLYGGEVSVRATTPVD